MAICAFAKYWKTTFVKKRFFYLTLFSPVGLALLLPGCGGGKLWPFDGDGATTSSRKPANATEYQCDGGKRFYVRMMDNGATAWLILPDREVALAKASSGSRYSNGIAVLEINGSEAALADGTVTYSGCKVPAPAAK